METIAYNKIRKYKNIVAMTPVLITALAAIEFLMGNPGLSALWASAALVNTALVIKCLTVPMYKISADGIFYVFSTTGKEIPITEEQRDQTDKTVWKLKSKDRIFNMNINDLSAEDLETAKAHLFDQAQSSDSNP